MTLFKGTQRRQGGSNSTHSLGPLGRCCPDLEGCSWMVLLELLQDTYAPEDQHQQVV